MNQTERIYRIEQLLHENRFVSFRQMQEAVEVSRATLKRDLQYLRDRLNAPIIYDREGSAGGGYRFEPPERHAPRHQLPGLWFNASEIHALLTMQNLLEEVQPGLLGPHIAPLLTRLHSLLGSQDNAPEEVTRRIRILHSARRLGNLQHFECIASALLKRQRLKIAHYNRRQNEETTREVSPQRLVYYRDNWYLDAWCHLRREIRSFAVDAVQRAELIDHKAHEVSRQKLDAVLGAGYGIFSGSQVQWALLRFSAQQARWVASEQWHPKQKTRMDDEGRYLLEIPYTQPTELLMDILRHGQGVEVLSPASLRNAVQQTLANALAQYTADNHTA
ncbi:MAG: WYL domain-containing protein [Sterolibacterium sp.]|jgi:predicted DNA-binding transcriptional regulator YafY|nr:WYL domain-containing protein [Sterolibacterium sp.]